MGEVSGETKQQPTQPTQPGLAEDLKTLAKIAGIIALIVLGLWVVHGIFPGFFTFISGFPT